MLHVIAKKARNEFSTTTHHEEGKMGTRFIGVDVGISGAIAILDSDTQEVSFRDTPSLEVVVGKKLRHVHDTYEMVRIQKDYTYIAMARVHMLYWVA